MVKKAKFVAKTTTNRGEFNHAYKACLEHQGKIHCSYCGYHRGENRETRWYGGYAYYDMEVCREKRKGTNTIFPNWKLVSKNRKQWMPKPIKIVTSKSRWNNNTYIDIKW